MNWTKASADSKPHQQFCDNLTPNSAERPATIFQDLIVWKLAAKFWEIEGFYCVFEFCIFNLTFGLLSPS
jgi:hypothetical protein